MEKSIHYEFSHSRKELISYVKNRFRLSTFEAEDVVQEAAITYFCEANCCHTNLYSLLGCKAKDFIRQRKSRKMVIVYSSETIGDFTEKLETITYEKEEVENQIDLERVWHKCRKKYPENTRAIALEIAGYSIEDIAKKIGKTKGATRAFLDNSRIKLQKYCFKKDF